MALLHCTIEFEFIIFNAFTPLISELYNEFEIKFYFTGLCLIVIVADTILAGSIGPSCDNDGFIKSHHRLLRNKQKKTLETFFVRQMVRFFRESLKLS